MPRGREAGLTGEVGDSTLRGTTYQNGSKATSAHRSRRRRSPPHEDKEGAHGQQQHEAAQPPRGPPRPLPSRGRRRVHGRGVCGLVLPRRRLARGRLERGALLGRRCQGLGVQRHVPRGIRRLQFLRQGCLQRLGVRRLGWHLCQGTAGRRGSCLRPTCAACRACPSGGPWPGPGIDVYTRCMENTHPSGVDVYT